MTGEVADELEPLMLLLAKERCPEEIEFEDAYGLPIDVVDLATVRLCGFGAVVCVHGDALVKVKVKYFTPSMFHIDIIILAWRGN
jgi:hypothetical protein